MSGPVRFLLGSAVTLALAMTACASKSPRAEGPTSPATPSSPGAGAYGGYGGGYTRGGSGSSSSGGSVAATVKQGPGGQFVFSPSTLTVKKGQTIAVKDFGSVAHTFTIQGKGIDVVNQAGQSSKVKIDLAPGTYTFICSFHISLGMQGKLTVTG
jgi:plastocyanin